MVRRVLAAALLAAVAGIHAQETQEIQAKAPVVEPGKFIIELEDNAGREELNKAIEGLAVTKLELNFKLFKGVSIQYKDPEQAEAAKEKLNNLASVKNVFRSHLRSIPRHEVHWSGGANADGTPSGPELLKRQSNGPTTFSPHLMTQVDKLREKGILGDGIKVAVIDTGVDYLHPALGGCFGPGCLVQFGYDLVGDNFNGSNTPVPDSDPMDCNGHGTHVSGTIAAQANNPFDFTGAAPGVILGHYRVFGCDGDTPDDVLIDAYNRAYEAGADLITASIGGPMGWSEDPWAVVVSRIVENGVPCTISAGNDGANGLFYASTAANGKKVTAIASVDNIIAPLLFTNATYTIDDASNTSFGYTPGEPAAWGGVTLPLYAIGFDTTDPKNACDPLPASTPDLSNYIVLIRRGTCFYTQKATNAAAKGAKYIIYYNNAAGTVGVDVSTVPEIKAVAMVTSEQGAAWVRLLAAGRKVTVAMTDPKVAPRFLINSVNTKSGGFLSTFTSWGPTYEAELKPQVSSPGGYILSTYPRAKGSYAVVSGTSMACPLTAAIYALIMQARKTKDPRTIENLLSATANPNLFHDGTNAYAALAPTSQQGAGLIQAYDAAYATSFLSVSSLSFNDTDNHIPFHEFSISNDGKTSVIYTLSHVGAATGYTFLPDGSIYPDTFPNELNTRFATITITPASVTIPAGQRRIIKVAAVAPAGLTASRLPVYGGYVAINGSDSSSLSLPYVGVAGSLHSVKVLGASDASISNSNDGANTPVPANTTFTLPPPGKAGDPAYANLGGLPELNFQLAFGTALLRFDIIPVEFCAGNKTVKDVLGVKTIGALPGSPLEYEPRGTAFRRWDGRLDDGTYAPAGTYKIIVRALRVYGDRAKATEYDAATTQTFRIRYISGGPGKRNLKKA